MLIITLEGGLVSSVVTDDEALRTRLNVERVAILNYDTEGADEAELMTIRTRHTDDQVPQRFLACGHVMPVDRADIDTEALTKDFELC